MSSEDPLHNQVKDKEQDRIYADVAGMLTNENNPEIFGPDLLPEEKIIREFRAFHVDQGRHGFRLTLMYILTCGLYLCYIKCCACLRSFGIGNKRTRACVTSFGRIMLWDTDCEGTKKNVHRGFHAVTNMEWYHLDDINSFQMLVRRENRCCPFKCCRKCGVFSTAMLRLFFGTTYPSTELVNGMGLTDCGAIQGMWKPEWSRSDHLLGAMANNRGVTSLVDFFEAVKNNAEKIPPGLFHCISCGWWYHPGVAIPSANSGKGEFALDIGSIDDGHWKDGYHTERSEAWYELTSLAKLILNAKEVHAPLANTEPNPDAFSLHSSSTMDEAVDSKLLISDNKIAIDDAKIPLSEDERVVDAIRIQPRIHWWEFFFVPTVSCKRKYKSNSAAFLTTHRAFSVSEFRQAGSGDYDFSLSSYFIGKVKGGMMVTDPKGSLGYATDIETSYGALRIQPAMSNKWPWSREVPEKKKERMYSFIRTLERACDIQAFIPVPDQKALPNKEDVEAMRERISLWDGEEICSVIRSENMYNVHHFRNYPMLNYLACGDIPNLTLLVQILSCGCRPWKLDQFLVLTTHRMISFQDVVNQCKVEFCQGKIDVTLWVPLQEIEAMQMDAEYETPYEDCLQRICKPVLKWCCNRDYATLGVRMGRKGRYGPAQFKIGRVAARAKKGLIEDKDDLKHFRAALGWYQSHKSKKQKPNVLKPIQMNSAYGKTPFPNSLNEDLNVSNPMIGKDGESSNVITVGTIGN